MNEIATKTAAKSRVATKTNIEDLDDNKVKLSVEIDAEEFEVAVDAAFKRLSREVNIPGFRRGKVPRRILEAQFGEKFGRTEALRAEIPEYYQQALLDNDVDAIDSPDIEITSGEEGGAVAFDAVVEVRPQVEVAGYQHLQIKIANPHPSDEDIDKEIDGLRSQHAVFQEVERPAEAGDRITIDIVTTHRDEEVPGLTATDYDYELGQGAVVPEIDENLIGASKGDEKQFFAPYPFATSEEDDYDPDDPDEQLYFDVEVLAVSESVLPEANDEWAAAASEFETLEELRANFFGSLRTAKHSLASTDLNNKILDGLASLVTQDIPKVLVTEEINQRLNNIANRIGNTGYQIDDYLSAIGKSMEEFHAESAESAENSVKSDLALRAVAKAEGLDATNDELAEELKSTGVDVAKQIQRLGESGQWRHLLALHSQHKALQWLRHNLEVRDEEDSIVDVEAMEATLKKSEETDSQEIESEESHAKQTQEAQ